MFFYKSGYPSRPGICFFFISSPPNQFTYLYCLTNGQKKIVKENLASVTILSFFSFLTKFLKVEYLYVGIFNRSTGARIWDIELKATYSLTHKDFSLRPFVSILNETVLVFCFDFRHSKNILRYFKQTNFAVKNNKIFITVFRNF